MGDGLGDENGIGLIVGSIMDGIFVMVILDGFVMANM